ncbi:hypothetical protein GN244_ATG14250 [Phytophthora infestans]|uniref:Uncharacterized protein n=1 Tax=Phytophthora infestans TaxID=4787 RepID=A0A833SFP5_PHYIN|nr:hypothetical protein GN244_ATG14250 [Phytophthora infestans]
MKYKKENEPKDTPPTLRLKPGLWWIDHQLHKRSYTFRETRTEESYMSIRRFASSARQVTLQRCTFDIRRTWSRKMQWCIHL